MHFGEYGERIVKEMQDRCHADQMHGPGREGCNVWDFTASVKFWTDGKHTNHGFMLHGDSKDWFRAYFREAEKVKDRPALLVVYEPK